MDVDCRVTVLRQGRGLQCHRGLKRGLQCYRGFMHEQASNTDFDCSVTEASGMDVGYSVTEASKLGQDQTSPGSYRPISLNSSLCKVLKGWSTTFCNGRGLQCYIGFRHGRGLQCH
ncbi:hypothetical protein J6590_094758 [Homalodisca vitripennis]|nr:hypothetical protein J6590_094078 [Homalodisca vitripennis]KAG8275043.1 hypothetical protein J6590_094758 [Homalodisca vitripennis]